MSRTPINPNVIDWSGENPSITLKSAPGGETTCLVSFFRVVVSPCGPGHAVFLLTDPSGARRGEAVNACFTDNEPLARYLLRDFVTYFGAWRGNPLLVDLAFKPAEGFVHSGDHVSTWTERVTGPDVDLSLTWRDFDLPFLVEFDAERSATGAHEMISLFVPARRADVVVNGTWSTGEPEPRDIAGKQSSTAFLAFSETWLKAQQ
jgi:hypothetical protein